MGSEHQDADRARAVRARDAHLAIAERLGFGANAAPCPYPAHRGRDWRRRDGGPLICGVCHPPAVPDDQIERVA
jgi:hypothetical protein